ncbi:AraC family transcriptional regulator ligand-binding domain-containing protein [Paraburkholderia sp. A2WS-5]|uniref:AraC family transcriptional regulator n=2 Tax=Paraburkholderia TaxID=1822464 RepID=UPI003B7B6F7E
MDTLIRTGVLTNYLKVAQQLGFKPQPLLRKLGLNSEMFADPECRIPASAAVTLLKVSAQMTQCPTFGLRMADLWQLSDLGVVSVLLTHQRTLREAVGTLIRFRHLLNEFLVIRMEDVGKKVIVREEFVADETGTSIQHTELVLGSLSRMCSTLMGAAWHPLSVHFTHDAPPDLRLHRRVFVGKLEFASSFNGMICRAADMDFPNPIADPVMARHAQRLLEGLPGASEPSIVLEVRKAIYLLLPVGRATIEQVAHGLGMNVRTLQRQLESAGSVFSEMVNGVRRDLVMHYMDNKSYTLGRIAESLGYSAYGSFVRWFEAQFGMTPTRWRSGKPANSR